MSNFNRQFVACLLLKVSCLLMLILQTGCNSAPIRASNLPAELQAPVYPNAKKVDLTKFSAATGSDDIIGRGDVIEVSITASLSKEDIVTFPVRVNDDGKAHLPLIGPIKLDQLHLSEAEASISESCTTQGLYKAPQVTVTMKNQRKNRVLVVGAVKTPGTYFISANNSDLLTAISQAGGLDDKAGTIVEIRNPTSSVTIDAPKIAGQEEGAGVRNVSSTNAENASSAKGSIKVDLASLTANNPNDLLIKDGGVVMVERRDPKPIHVTGLVRRPNKVDFPVAEDLKLLDAISLAEGTSNPLADKVYIIRSHHNAGKPVLIQASIQKAKSDPKENLRLSPGDLVSVEKTTSTVLYDVINIVKFGVGATVF